MLQYTGEREEINKTVGIQCINWTQTLAVFKSVDCHAVEVLKDGPLEGGGGCRPHQKLIVMTLCHGYYFHPPFICECASASPTPVFFKRPMKPSASFICIKKMGWRVRDTHSQHWGGSKRGLQASRTMLGVGATPHEIRPLRCLQHHDCCDVVRQPLLPPAPIPTSTFGGPKIHWESLS